MIIDTLRCKRITREMTDLMNAYNIQILDVEPYAEMDESLYCSVSYRANRIFEANQFKNLVSVLDEVIKDNAEDAEKSYLVWTELFDDGLFTIGKKYPIIEYFTHSVEVINDKNQSQHVAVNDSIYGTNKVVK